MAQETDNSQLVTTGVIFVSPDGCTTYDPFPIPGVEYDFCVNVINNGKLSSGPFLVRFTLSGDQDPALDLEFKMDDGLDAGVDVQAVDHFGSFPNQFGTYDLNACIFSLSAPEKPINCADEFYFTITNI